MQTYTIQNQYHICAYTHIYSDVMMLMMNVYNQVTKCGIFNKFQNSNYFSYIILNLLNSHASRWNFWDWIILWNRVEELHVLWVASELILDILIFIVMSLWYFWVIISKITGFFPVAASGSFFLVAVHGLIVVASLIAEHGL